MIYYTYSERTVKKYTVEDAVKAAKIVLDGKVKLCINALYDKRLPRDDKITLVELNELSERLVDDSRYYAN